MKVFRKEDIRNINVGIISSVLATVLVSGFGLIMHWLTNPSIDKKLSQGSFIFACLGLLFVLTLTIPVESYDWSDRHPLLYRLWLVGIFMTLSGLAFCVITLLIYKYEVSR